MPTRSRPDASPLTDPTPDLAPVTGVARGNLGTATNLDDTQVYALDELRAANLDAEPMAPPAQEPGPRPAPVRRRAPGVAERGPVDRGRRTGLIAVGAAAGLLGLAVVLTVRDGATVGPGGPGQGAGGAAEVRPSSAPATMAPATAPAEVSGGGNGRGNGNGNGNGRGND